VPIRSKKREKKIEKEDREERNTLRELSGGQNLLLGWEELKKKKGAKRSPRTWGHKLEDIQKKKRKTAKEGDRKWRTNSRGADEEGLGNEKKKRKCRNPRTQRSIESRGLREEIKKALKNPATMGELRKTANLRGGGSLGARWSWRTSALRRERYWS